MLNKTEKKSITKLEVLAQEKVVIPLHDELETILSKYNEDFPPIFAINFDSNAVLTDISKRFVRLKDCTK